MQQNSALNILKSGHSVFLTGLAGSGKTHLLNKYIRYMRGCSAKIAVTASTGIAATHIGGMTIHSWSGLGIRNELSQKDLQSIAKKKPVRDRIIQTRVLIIDEISMLSAKQLSCVDQILRYFKVTPEPFGGIQVIFCGDFLQLPPVNQERLPPKQLLAFMSPVWAQTDLRLCYLNESYRHEDDNLFKVLSDIRAGEISIDSQEMLEDKLNQSNSHPNEEAIKLYTHNRDVDTANLSKLEELSGKAKQFDAYADGKQIFVDALKKSVMAPEILRLKKNAKVMFVKNNSEENYMNGTLGKVVGFTDDGLPEVKTLEGERITASPVDWDVLDEQGEVIATYNQIPLRLAWAITVHKSQGMTLDCAAMNLSRTFEPGQGYVALSRVKTWDGLYLFGCNQNALAVDPLMLNADERFRALSHESEQKISVIPEKDLNKDFAKHIIKCGGKAKLDDMKKQNPEE